MNLTSDTPGMIEVIKRCYYNTYVRASLATAENCGVLIFVISSDAACLRPRVVFACHKCLWDLKAHFCAETWSSNIFSCSDFL